MKRVNLKTLFICVLLIIIVLFFSIYYKYKNSIDYEKMDSFIYLKDYEVNEYTPVSVDEEDMAKRYIINYKNIMINDSNKAYELLNKEYRDKKFSSIDNFNQYISEMMGKVFYEFKVEKYNVTISNGKKIFYVYDSAGLLFIFKENSIMQYEVYFDNYTVKI